VKPLHEYDLLEVVKRYHRASEMGEKMIAFGPLANFLPDDEDGQEEEGKDGEHGEHKTPADEGAAETAARTDGHEASRPGLDRPVKRRD
jgi:hypothetical protein